MPALTGRLGNLFSSDRPSLERSVSEQVESETGRVSPALTLPPYTVEPFGASSTDSAPASLQSSQTELPSTLTDQIQHLHATLDRSRWPINPEYNPQTPRSTAVPPLPLSSPQPEPTPGPSSTSNNSQPNLTIETTPVRQEDPYVRAGTVQRSKLIMEALAAGEDIYAMHHRNLRQTSGEWNDQITQTRLQSIHVGELVLKTLRYIRNVRKSSTSSERFTRNQLDRVLQLSLKLQRQQLNLKMFWTDMLNIVGEMQNMLSKHHLDLGIEELVSNISDVETRMALMNITQ